MTSKNIDDLFARTLAGSYDDDVPWEAVSALRKLGTQEVFEVAATWCASDNPLMRARGIDVLAQLGKTFEHPVNSFPERSYAVVSELLNREQDPRALESAIFALGHLDNAAAVPLVAPFYSHPRAEIRYAVAFALGSFPNDDLSVKTLLLLMEDSGDNVRDWATFGLGVLGDQDSPAIRDALCRRLIDTDEDAREEAMVGLAKRRDPRVLPSLFAAVNAPDPTIKVRVAEAASLMLGMERDPEDWGKEEYRAALTEHFPR